MPLPGFLPFARIKELAEKIRGNGKIRGWSIAERRRKEVALDLFTICSFLGNDCKTVNTPKFLKWMEAEFQFVIDSQNPLNQLLADFLERDDNSDTRTSDPAFCELPSTRDQWSLNITVLSFLIKSGSYNTTRGPSREAFNRAHGTSITKEFWKKAVDHSESAHFDRLFLYQKNGRREVLNQGKVLKVLVDNEIVTPLKGKFYRKEQQYTLPPGKTVTVAKKEVTKILRAELGNKINQNLVNAHWPSTLVRKYSCKTRKCRYCDIRKQILSIVRKEYGVELDPEHLTHRYYGLERQLKTRITDEFGVRRYLRVGEKERLKNLMKDLAMCDWHFSRNFHQRKWWSNKLENLDGVTVLVQIDFMADVPLQEFQGQLAESSPERTVPFGLTLHFRDPDSGENVKLDRVLIPNFENPNAHYLIECFKKVLLNQSDTEIQEVVSRMRHLFIMNDTASYLKSGECALYFAWNIKDDFSFLRESTLCSRVHCHSVMQVDRLFGCFSSALKQAAKGRALKTRLDLKTAFHQTLRESKDEGNLLRNWT